MVTAASAKESRSIPAGCRLEIRRADPAHSSNRPRDSGRPPSSLRQRSRHQRDERRSDEREGAPDALLCEGAGELLGATRRGASLRTLDDRDLPLSRFARADGVRFCGGSMRCGFEGESLCCGGAFLSRAGRSGRFGVESRDLSGFDPLRPCRGASPPAGGEDLRGLSPGDVSLLGRSSERSCREGAGLGPCEGFVFGATRGAEFGREASRLSRALGAPGVTLPPLPRTARFAGR